jgi:crotonobetainyl-CoA:carnitine CoA-transferase CaiB-like acyl-CoA transferase
MRVDENGVVGSDPTPELMYGIASAGEGTAAGAVHAAMHVAAALFHRERTGEGAFLDAAGSDAVISAGWIGATYNLNEHRITDRSSLPSAGGDGGSSAKYQYYATKDDRFVLFCAIEPKFWNAFCSLVDRPDLVDEKPSAPVDFAVGQENLRHEIQSIIATRTLADWMDVATVHGLPIGPAYRSRDIVDDPHLATRQILVEGEHPRAGSFTYVGEPVIVRGQPYEVPTPAPLLGEHTDEVLVDLGWSTERIEALRAAGGC